MALWKAVLLGVLQGVTSILPVSSSGHIALMGYLLGESGAESLSFMVLLHLGTWVGLMLFFRRDLARLFLSFLRIVRDALWDVPVLLNRLQQPGSGTLRSPGGSQFRRFALLLLVALLPTLPIGLAMRRFAAIGASNLLITAMGFFVTALLLLVSSFMITGKRTPKMVRYRDAFWIGVFQGASLLPGLSRTGLTYSAAGLVGVSGNFRVRMTYLLAIPTILGSLLVLLPQRETMGGLQVGFLPSLVGILAAAATSYGTLSLLRRILSRRTSRGFAVYTMLMGIACIVAYFH